MDLVRALMLLQHARRDARHDSDTSELVLLVDRCDNEVERAHLARRAAGWDGAEGPGR